jgi:S-adenosylmethionine synthetase
VKLHLTALTEPAGDLLDIEIVERKGLGHPDTICDHLAEELSLCLSQQYLSQFGHILHYNVDKALLWGGASRPVFGGGVVDKPMELFLAGRATTSIGGIELPLEELARATVEGWLTKHMPRIEVGKHLITHCLVRPGSSDLIRLSDRSAGPTALLCNDTSCGLGYAPLSRLETIVYSIEQELGALAASENPEIGRDIKVMGVRRGCHIDLTIACAFIGQFISRLLKKPLVSPALS